MDDITLEPILNVYALPRYVEPEEMAGDTVVVIDVLRAATTIIHALAAGAKQVIPCLEVDEARQVAAKWTDGEALLGGERKCLPIEGFHLGNSPSEYTAEQVAGKTIVLTSTNGTRAMIHARQAGEVLVGAMVNASAVARRLLDRERIHILCSGSNGEVGDDDVLLAGMLVERLVREGGMVYRQNAQAVTAREFWLGSFALPIALGAEPLEPERLAAQLQKSPGGRRLVDLGREADILAASQFDRFDIVPRFDPKAMRITKG